MWEEFLHECRSELEQEFHSECDNFQATITIGIQHCMGDKTHYYCHEAEIDANGRTDSSCVDTLFDYDEWQQVREDPIFE